MTDIKTLCSFRKQMQARTHKHTACSDCSTHKHTACSDCSTHKHTACSDCSTHKHTACSDCSTHKHTACSDCSTHKHTACSDCSNEYTIEMKITMTMEKDILKRLQNETYTIHHHQDYYTQTQRLAIFMLELWGVYSTYHLLTCM